MSLLTKPALNFSGNNNCSSPETITHYDLRDLCHLCVAPPDRQAALVSLKLCFGWIPWHSLWKINGVRGVNVVPQSISWQHQWSPLTLEKAQMSHVQKNGHLKKCIRVCATTMIIVKICLNSNETHLKREWHFI